jgi:hypothetical protein
MDSSRPPCLWKAVTLFSDCGWTSICTMLSCIVIEEASRTLAVVRIVSFLLKRGRSCSVEAWPLCTICGVSCIEISFRKSSHTSTQVQRTSLYPCFPKFEAIVLNPSANMTNCFAAAFSNEGEPGCCFGYDDLQHMSYKSLPHGLIEQLHGIRDNGEKVVSLSVGLDSRYWTRYTKGDKFVKGMFYWCT